MSLACWPTGIVESSGHTSCASSPVRLYCLSSQHRRHQSHGTGVRTWASPRHSNVHISCGRQRRRAHIRCSQANQQNTLSPPNSIVIHSAGGEVRLPSDDASLGPLRLVMQAPEDMTSLMVADFPGEWRNWAPGERSCHAQIRQHCRHLLGPHAQHYCMGADT